MELVNLYTLCSVCTVAYILLPEGRGLSSPMWEVNVPGIVTQLPTKNFRSASRQYSQSSRSGPEVSRFSSQGSTFNYSFISLSLHFCCYLHSLTVVSTDGFALRVLLKIWKCSISRRLSRRLSLLTHVYSSKMEDVIYWPGAGAFGTPINKNGTGAEHLKSVCVNGTWPAWQIQTSTFTCAWF